MSGVCEKWGVCDKLRCEEDSAYYQRNVQILGEMLAHPHEPYIQTAALCDRYTLDFGWGDHEP